MDTLLWFKSQTGKTLTDVLLSQFLIQFSRMTKLNPGKTKENILGLARSIPITGSICDLILLLLWCLNYDCQLIIINYFGSPLAVLMGELNRWCLSLLWSVTAWVVSNYVVLL